MLKSIKELLFWEDFEDLFIKLENNKNIVFYSKKWKIFKKWKFTEDWKKDFLNSNLNQNKNSYSVKYNKIFFRVARIWKKYTIRKLWYTFNFFEKYNKDPVLFSFISNVLLQNYNKTLLISWRTWSWKTTFILSLLNMFNDFTYNDILKLHITKVVKNILKQKKIYIEIWDNIETVIKDYLQKEELEILKDLVWKFIEEIKIEKLFEKYNNWSVFTIEKPIEYFFEEDNNLFFNQNQISNTNADEANNSYINMLDIALQSNPNIIYISEIKNKIEYERFLDTIYVWPAIIASNHSNNVFQNLKRIESITDNEKEVKSKITMWLWGLINFERYNVIWDNIYLSSYELLKMYENKVKSSYFSNKIDIFINQMTIEFKNKNYYINHFSSLLYNIYLYYISWKDFILKDFKLKVILNILNNNKDTLKNVYNLTDEALNFLETKLIENYQKISI